jgi:hypothetical protein
MKQYSDEYWKMKLGKLSASNMCKIVSATGKASTSCKDYIFKQLSELETGYHEDEVSTYHMNRGLELEPKARETFTFITGLEVEEVGVITNSKYDFLCCSPDGIAPDHKKFGLEVKCPSPGVHLKTRYEKKIPTTHWPQIFSSLWLCSDIECWYFMSYHPDMEPFLQRVDRKNPDYIAYVTALEKRLPEVVKFINDVKNVL